MDILKSFEVFLSEPMSVLKNGIVQIVGINTGDNSKPAINADLLNNKAQITVVNSDKMYNLLKRVNSKREKSLPLKEKPIFGQLTLRV